MDHLTIGNGKMEVEDPGIRFQWEMNGFKSVFKYYTKNQYKEAFSKDPVGFHGWRDFR